VRVELLLPALIVVAGCECLTSPRTDNTPPEARISVEYREPGGQRVSRTLTVGSSDTTVVADAADVISVTYAGGDNEGLRRIDLDYAANPGAGTAARQPQPEDLHVEFDCAHATLTGTQKFGPGAPGSRYEFATTATNWVGLAAKSGKVIVQTR
jgi:hypothetical protein